MIRTCSSAWLSENHCEHPLRHISHKVSRLSGMPESNMENLQVVKYIPGQEFAIQTDHLVSFNYFDCRERFNVFDLFART